MSEVQVQHAFLTPTATLDRPPAAQRMAVKPRRASVTTDLRINVRLTGGRATKLTRWELRGQF